MQALGVFTAGTLTAASVAILPPPLLSAEGVVTAINGVTTKGICATSGATVPFTLTGIGHWAIVTTVDVDRDDDVHGPRCSSRRRLLPTLMSASVST